MRIKGRFLRPCKAVTDSHERIQFEEDEGKPKEHNDVTDLAIAL